MAERLKGKLMPNPGGRRPIYPWHEWTDGSVWRVTYNKDFKIPTSSFRYTLYTHARKKGLSVSVQGEGNDSLVFQFKGERNGKQSGTADRVTKRKARRG